MPVTISNERLGPISRYHDEAGPHTRPRDTFRPESKMDFRRWAPAQGDTPILQVPPSSLVMR